MRVEKGSLPLFFIIHDLRLYFQNGFAQRKWEKLVQKFKTKKNCLPLDDAFRNFLTNSDANFVFILIDMSAIDCPVACIDGIFNSLLDLTWWGLFLEAIKTVKRFEELNKQLNKLK